MARTHMQMPQAALLHCFTRSGWKSSIGRNGVIFLIVAGVIASLSKFCNDFRKSDSLTIFFDGPHQSSTILPASSLTRPGLISFMMQTVWSTSFTGKGGLAMALISPMSLAVSVSSAFKASCSAGIASSRSASTSAFTASADAAASDATASSFATTSLITCVFTDSAFTVTIMASTSIFLATSFGCRSMSSTFMPATDSSVVRIFSRPVEYLSLRSATCFRLTPSSVLKVAISSRKDVGVA
mmetsp:Transcript_1277/g.3626  ORF Transcript_1277/g.3626 Transcript_1277/m.3626 type:complete len:241 (-) Transcript_1277:167-889(-)